MSEQPTGSCQIIGVDARELYWLRTMRLLVSDFAPVQKETFPHAPALRMVLEQLEPWKDAPLVEEWR